MYANGAVGLAKLRRDGFASLQARFPGATMTTRPLLFSGDRLFVNVNTAGAPLMIECLGEDNLPLPGFAKEDCEPYCGNTTCAEIRWRGGVSLGRLAGRPVRFRFHLDRGDLYAFWVTDSPHGESHGYRGAGGPINR